MQDRAENIGESLNETGRSRRATPGPHVSSFLFSLDLVSLHAFLALHGDEGHALAFLQTLEA